MMRFAPFFLFFFFSFFFLTWISASISADMTWIGLFRRFKPIWPNLVWIDPSRHISGNEKKKKKKATWHQLVGSDVTPRTPRRTLVQHPCSCVGALENFSHMQLLHDLVMGRLRPNTLHACDHSCTSLFFYLAKPITSILLFAPI